MHKRRLDSWKAIAEFLGRSVRTVQRWHDLNGLPVHRFGGRKGGVFAFENEIDVWLAALAESSQVTLERISEESETSRSTSRELTTVADRMWETRSTLNIQTIADLYRRAIDIDSTNAAAFIGLANAVVFCAVNGAMDGTVAFPMAQDAMRRISASEFASVDAKCPAAWIDLLYSRNWRQARTVFEEVVSSRPSSSFALSGLSLTKIVDGDLDGAMTCAWEAWRLNPLVDSLGGILCWIAYLKGEFEYVLDLATQMRNGGALGSVTRMVESLAIAQAPNPSASLSRLETAIREQPQDQQLYGALGYAYAVAGEEAKARGVRTTLAHAAKSGMRSKGYPLALVCLALGEEQEALSWLEASYTEGALWSLGFQADPILRSLRAHPRFERLPGKIGGYGPCLVVNNLNTCATSPRSEDLLVGSNS